MSGFVVDASVAVKWVVPEEQSDDARRLLGQDHDLVVPDLVYAEAGNVLWKRVNRGDATAEEAVAALKLLVDLPLNVRQIAPLAHSALDIAVRTGRTVYDSLYLALAVETEYLLVTADRRLYNALQGGPFAARLLWVENLP